MSSTTLPVDSATALRPADADLRWPAAPFPPLTDHYLRDFLTRLLSAMPGDLTARLPTMREPNLYILAVATARYGRAGDRDQLAAALRAELRWRNCRNMGADPTGAVRRGRLLQLCHAGAALTVAGPSPLQRDKLSGDCPFCAAGASFQVFLPQVRWRCFHCDRSGGVLEFAENLLTAIPPPSSSPEPPTPGSGPAAS